MPKATVIKPKNLDIPKMKQAVDEGLKNALAVGKVLYKGTYHNWEAENQPEFKETGPRTRKGRRELEYSTTSTPYIWVDLGTDGPYTITAKNAPMLKFKVGGMPKTFKGSLISTSGMPGDAWRSAKEVTHPGIDPRGFSNTVAHTLYRDSIVTDNVQTRISKAVS